MIMFSSDLTHARLRELVHYDPDFGEFRSLVTRGKWPRGRVLRNLSVLGYARVYVDGRLYLAHRLAWFYVHGEWPPRGFEIDHINRVRHDNRISNLRVVTRSVNLRNRSGWVRTAPIPSS